jgi:orotate phosphoribosyltransferase
VGENTKFVLVDDVITRGSTLLGCANKILDVWNHADIYGFVVFRTISNHYEFKNFLDPITGIITYRSETKDTIREEFEFLGV